MPVHRRIADVPITVRSDGPVATVFLDGERLHQVQLESAGAAARAVEGAESGLDAMKQSISNAEDALSGDPERPLQALQSVGAPTWVREVFEDQARDNRSGVVAALEPPVRATLEGATETETIAGGRTPEIQAVKDHVRSWYENPTVLSQVRQMAGGNCRLKNRFGKDDPQRAYNVAAAGTYILLQLNDNLEEAAQGYSSRCGTPQRHLASEVLSWVKGHRNTLDAVRTSTQPSEESQERAREAAVEQPDMTVEVREGETLREAEIRMGIREGPGMTDEEGPGMTDIEPAFVTLPQLMNRAWDAVRNLAGGG